MSVSGKRARVLRFFKAIGSPNTPECVPDHALQQSSGLVNPSPSSTTHSIQQFRDGEDEQSVSEASPTGLNSEPQTQSRSAPKIADTFPSPSTASTTSLGCSSHGLDRCEEHHRSTRTNSPTDVNVDVPRGEALYRESSSPRITKDVAPSDLSRPETLSGHSNKGKGKAASVSYDCDPEATEQDLGDGSLMMITTPLNHADKIKTEIAHADTASNTVIESSSQSYPGLDLWRPPAYDALNAGSSTAPSAPARARHTANPLQSKSNLTSSARVPFRTQLWEGTKFILETAKESTDFFPPVKSALGLLTGIIKQAEKVGSNVDDLNYIRERIYRVGSLLLSSDTRLSGKEESRRTPLKRTLYHCIAQLPQSDAGAISAFFQANRHREVLMQAADQLRDAIMDYEISLQVELAGDVKSLLETENNQAIQRLLMSPQAEFLSSEHNGCLPGTRRDILQQIEEWASATETDRRIYWLHGHAGSGKSTIAMSVARSLFAQGLLGASFFCSRDYANKSDLKLIFPTIAAQLARSYPSFSQHLSRILKARPTIGQESLFNQMQALICEPLNASGASTIIIIDALDECVDELHGHPASAILSILARCIDELPNAKFFITGRPELPIRQGFRLPALQPHTMIFRLHEVQRSRVDQDIELYLRLKLDEIVSNRSDTNLSTSWYTPDDIEIIVSKASGLFIYAATAVKFIASDLHNPVERLQVITSTPASMSVEGAAGLDALYTRVLLDGFSGVPLKETTFWKQLKSILAAITLVYEPLTKRGIQDVSALGNIDVTTPLRSLHSVLFVSEFEALSIIHKSFPDYITDPERCQDARFYISPAAHHFELARNCLSIMRSQLRRNICSLAKRTFNVNNPHLADSVSSHVGEGLRYACVFWTRHLIAGDRSSALLEALLPLLEDFFKRRLAMWLEVLSITDELTHGIRSMENLRAFFESIPSVSESIEARSRVVMQWTADTLHFICSQFDCIRDSAVNLYFSAFHLTPQNSLLRAYIPKSGELRVLHGKAKERGNHVRSINAGGLVQMVVFSHDLTMLAVGSYKNKRVQTEIFRTVTWERVAELRHGDQGPPNNYIAFSPDDGFIVTSSGSYAYVWDTQTGGLVTMLSREDMESPESQKLLRFLSLHTKIAQSENERQISCLAFSPAGKKFAVAWRNGGIRVWDTNDWLAVQPPSSLSVVEQTESSASQTDSSSITEPSYESDTSSTTSSTSSSSVMTTTSLDLSFLPDHMQRLHEDDLALARRAMLENTLPVQRPLHSLSLRDVGDLALAGMLAGQQKSPEDQRRRALPIPSVAWLDESQLIYGDTWGFLTKMNTDLFPGKQMTREPAHPSSVNHLRTFGEGMRVFSASSSRIAIHDATTMYPLAIIDTSSGISDLACYFHRTYNGDYQVFTAFTHDKDNDGWRLRFEGLSIKSDSQPPYRSSPKRLRSKAAKLMREMNEGTKWAFDATKRLTSGVLAYSAKPAYFASCDGSTVNVHEVPRAASSPNASVPSEQYSAPTSQLLSAHTDMSSFEKIRFWGANDLIIGLGPRGRSLGVFSLKALREGGNPWLAYTRSDKARYFPGIVFSQNGNLLAYQSDDRLSCHVQLDNNTTSVQRLLLQSTDPAFITISADTDFVASFQNGNIKVWDTRTGQLQAEGQARAEDVPLIRGMSFSVHVGMLYMLLLEFSVVQNRTSKFVLDPVTEYTVVTDSYSLPFLLRKLPDGEGDISFYKPCSSPLPSVCIPAKFLDGWVLGMDGKPVLWLPTHLRGEARWKDGLLACNAEHGELGLIDFSRCPSAVTRSAP
ncbi:hypothetical protein HGRIS_010686 [Hohenbuehelia grisea]|uniref:NACHT domain-containing protein n=1 Tax=Hohenbuehelia grisea TaxID=104357 RepID=A0ABR3IXU3_9AGAR